MGVGVGGVSARDSSATRDGRDERCAARRARAGRGAGPRIVPAGASEATMRIEPASKANLAIESIVRRPVADVEAARSARRTAKTLKPWKDERPIAPRGG